MQESIFTKRFEHGLLSANPRCGRCPFRLVSAKLNLDVGRKGETLSSDEDGWMASKLIYSSLSCALVRFPGRSALRCLYNTYGKQMETTKCRHLYLESSKVAGRYHTNYLASSLGQDSTNYVVSSGITSH